MADQESVRGLARDCARRLPAPPSSFYHDRFAFEDAFQALLSDVRGSHERFAFDLEGRPAAIAAIRRALPAVEAELFDAVLDDVACELAAVQETLYQVALAAHDGD